MMTRRELVTAAIGHQATPRVPYNIRPDGEMQGRLRQRLGWTEARPQTLGRLDLNDWLDNDVEMIAIPWWTWHELAPDWRGPYPPESPARVIGTGGYASFYEDLKRLRQETDRYTLAMVYGSHFEKAYFARGFGNFLMDVAGDRGFARRLCQGIIERNLVMLELVVHCPEIDGVLLGSDWGCQRGELMSLEAWDDLIRPGEQREYDLLHAWGKHVWVHSCGKIDALIPRLVEMGVDVLNPVQPECMDLAALKRDHGGRLAFWGGINTQQLLPFGTPEQVRAEARRTRALLAAGGGYILAPAQDVQADVPFANLDALLEVAREGKAPG